METFSALLAICAGIHRSPVNSPHKGQWRGALVISMICAWINGWVNNRKAGYLRRNRTHYDVIVMSVSSTFVFWNPSDHASFVVHGWWANKALVVDFIRKGYYDSCKWIFWIRWVRSMFDTDISNILDMSWGQRFDSRENWTRKTSSWWRRHEMKTLSRDWPNVGGQSTGDMWIPFTKRQLWGALMFSLLWA